MTPLLNTDRLVVSVPSQFSCSSNSIAIFFQRRIIPTLLSVSPPPSMRLSRSLHFWQMAEYVLSHALSNKRWPGSISPQSPLWFGSVEFQTSFSGRPSIHVLENSPTHLCATGTCKGHVMPITTVKVKAAANGKNLPHEHEDPLNKKE